MRKKLDTRFPAAWIKKIMQADEDVGKIAMAVPVLVSKALELFLQDLCDHTYDITLQRGAKTVSALHLKHYIHSYVVFDFLREVVSKVPDYGHSHAADEMSKRRKIAADEINESDEESRRYKMMCHGSSNSRGRGKGRGRGCGRRTRVAEQEPSRHEMEYDPCTSSEHGSKQLSSPRTPTVDSELKDSSSKENSSVIDGANPAARNFNLNTGMGDTKDKTTTATVAGTVSAGPSDPKDDEHPGSSLSEIDKMNIVPFHVTQMNSRLDDDDEG